MLKYLAIILSLVLALPALVSAQTRQENIQNRNEIRDTRQENRGQIRENVQTNLKVRLENVYNRIKLRVTRRYERLSELIASVNQRIEKLSEQGKDTTAAKSHIDLAVADLQTAKGYLQQADAIIAGLSDSTDLKAAFAEVRSLVKQGYTSANSSRSHIKEAIKALRQLNQV